MHHVFCRGGDFAHGFGDADGGIFGVFGQRSDFIGHHRKASALFARASGFDGRIECQEVGLIGDLTNGADHGADGLALFTQYSGTLVHVGQRVLQIFQLSQDQLRGVTAFGGSVHHGLSIRFDTVELVGHKRKIFLIGSQQFQQTACTDV